jgi:hypothetical protein
MLINVTPAKEIAKYLTEIQSVIESAYDDDITIVIERAQMLEGYMALSGKLLADAKYHYNEQFESGFVKAMKDTSKYNASTTNMYLRSLCKDFQYLVDWADRINASCTHQIDFGRTLISKYKAEMQLQR